MSTEAVLVIENEYKNYTHTLDDGVYVVQVQDADIDGADFQDAVLRGSITEDFELEPAGTIAVPVYRAKKKE